MFGGGSVSFSELSMSHCQCDGYAQPINFRHDVHNEQLKSSDMESSITIERTRELLKLYEHDWDTGQFSGQLCRF